MGWLMSRGYGTTPEAGRTARASDGGPGSRQRSVSQSRLWDVCGWFRSAATWRRLMQVTALTGGRGRVAVPRPSPLPRPRPRPGGHLVAVAAPHRRHCLAHSARRERCWPVTANRTAPQRSSGPNRWRTSGGPPRRPLSQDLDAVGMCREVSAPNHGLNPDAETPSGGSASRSPARPAPEVFQPWAGGVREKSAAWMTTDDTRCGGRTSCLQRSTHSDNRRCRHGKWLQGSHRRGHWFDPSIAH